MEKRINCRNELFVLMPIIRNDDDKLKLLQWLKWKMINWIDCFQSLREIQAMENDLCQMSNQLRCWNGENELSKSVYCYYLICNELENDGEFFIFYLL